MDSSSKATVLLASCHRLPRPGGDLKCHDGCFEAVNIRSLLLRPTSPRHVPQGPFSACLDSGVTYLILHMSEALGRHGGIEERYRNEKEYGNDDK